MARPWQRNGGKTILALIVGLGISYPGFVSGGDTKTAVEGPTPPKLTDLGALLPESVPASFAVSLNDLGQVVGMAYDPVNWERYSAVVWQPGPSGFEVVFLGNLDGPVLYELSIPENWGGAQRAINRDGFIVGRALEFKSGRLWPTGPVIWSKAASGSFIPSPLPGSQWDSARALNGSRQIIGDSLYWADPTSSPVPLPVPLGFEDPDVYDINDAGQVVGLAYELPAYAEHPMLWEPDGEGGFVPTVLPSPAGSTLTVPSAISNSGKVVGYALVPGNQVAVAWDKGASGWEWKALDPPGGCVAASAYGVNAAGHVVGTAWCGVYGVAVLWTPNGEGVLEATVLPAEGDGFSAAYAHPQQPRASRRRGVEVPRPGVALRVERCDVGVGHDAADHRERRRQPHLPVAAEPQARRGDDRLRRDG
jgi:hypothetical protein